MLASARVRAGEHFNDMLQQLDLCLDVASMLPWTRWITPLVPSVQTKRFDTRFFVTTVPAGQQASHDMVEATASAWLSPRAAPPFAQKRTTNTDAFSMSR